MWRRIKRGLVAIVLTVLVTAVLLVVSLRWIDPPFSAFILRHNLQAALGSEANPALYSWTGWSSLSKEYAAAVVAAEDQRFPDHYGIDFIELRSAISGDDAAPRGASTITQQTAKNLFLWRGRSYTRKILEAAFAILMEALLSKQRILEIYLNIAQTGPDMYGITAASQRYFGKPQAQLNRHEAASIAAILPNPSHYSATHPSAYVQERQRWILGQVRQLGGTSYLHKL